MYELQKITIEEKVIIAVKENLVDSNTTDSDTEWMKEYIDKYRVY